jgi:hypothetical protein
MGRSSRYVIRPCDEPPHGLSPGERGPKPRTWDVWDKATGRCAANYDLRQRAREEAARLNAEAAVVSA